MNFGTNIMRNPTKTVFILSILLILFCRPVYSAQETGTHPASKAYTLEELYHIAQKNSESIKIADQNLYIAEKDKNRAISALIPWLTAFGNHTRYDEPDPTQPDSSTYGARLDYSFTLNGKELTGYKMAKDAIKKSEYDLQSVKEAYFYQVAEAFFTIAAFKKNINISSINTRRLEKHRDAVLSKLKLRAITKTDLFRADAELSQAKTDLVRVKNMLQHSRAALINLVGLPGHFEIEEPDINVTASPAIDLAGLKQDALSNRAELKSQELERKIRAKNIKLSKGDYWPTVSIEGIYQDTQYTYTTTDTDGNETDIDDDNESYSAALNLNFTLFDSGLRRAQISQAKAGEKIAALALARLKKQITLEVEEAYLDLLTQKSVLESLTDQLKSSQEHFNAVSKEYKHGLSNSLDVVDANTLLKKTEREFVNARYQYKLAEIKLKRAKGTFLAEIREARDNP